MLLTYTRVDSSKRGANPPESNTEADRRRDIRIRFR